MTEGNGDFDISLVKQSEMCKIEVSIFTAGSDDKVKGCP